MGIVNKRNAFLGWAVWKVGKRVLKRKAKAVVPGTGSDGAPGVAKPAIAAGVAALAGALYFWQRRPGTDEADRI